MADEKRFAVIQIPELKWPTSTSVPASRFRLFVAADLSNVSIDAICEFASAALSRGMVYLCAWGRDCERLHEIVDEVVAEDDIGERRFAGPTSTDVVMTTWHKDETLEEALEFFSISAIPTEGFAANSDFRLAICVGNPEWARTATRVLQSTKSFG